MTKLLKTNAAIVIGVLLSVLTGVQQWIAENGADAIDWQTVLPLIASIVIRQFVFSGQSVEALSGLATTVKPTGVVVQNFPVVEKITPDNS